MKKPTIKATNRAYVRLFDRVVTHRSWDEFLTTYRVQMVDYGMRRNGDCAVQVLNSDGKLADLGPDIPNRITYSSYVAPERITWTEHFRDGDRTWTKVDSR